jgi:hypothetical protein
MFSYSAFTWFAQNHPVILELYRRHGKDLWFAGGMKPWTLLA